ncbi:MAG: Hpt domain-containing protein, partial [Proteobacteria bacterium]|nr:Hpt domain-containing protein [Pseudomonadota bacterium]
MDEMQEIIQDFIVESNELIESLDKDLIELEKSGSEEETKELLNSIFRAVHTIKGASGFLGFGQLIDVCHVMETLFNKLRHGEQELTTYTMDIFLESMDIVKLLIEKVDSGDEEEYPIDGILEKLNAIIDAGGDPAADVPAAHAPQVEISAPQVETSAPQVETSAPQVETSAPQV